MRLPPLDRPVPPYDPDAPNRPVSDIDLMTEVIAEYAWKRGLGLDPGDALTIAYDVASARTGVPVAALSDALAAFIGKTTTDDAFVSDLGDALAFVSHRGGNVWTLPAPAQHG